MSNSEVEQEANELYAEMSARLNELELQVYSKNFQHDKVLTELAKTFLDWDKQPYVWLLQQEVVGTIGIATRMSAVIVKLMSDLSYRFNLQELVMLTNHKRNILSVMEASGFGGSGFLHNLLLEKTKEYSGKGMLENQAMVRAIAVASISQIDTATLVELSIQNSEVAAILTLGLMTELMPSTLVGEASRRLLLEEYNPYGNLQPIERYRGLISNSWMVCSYSTSEKKHHIKRHLNDWFKRVHVARNLKVHPFGSIDMPGNTEGKAVMAVMAESFGSAHAMYRWYAPLVERLKAHYYVVLVALEMDVDAKSKAIFDHYITVPKADEMGLQPVLDACTPDVAYFPSVGMRTWCISMANLRWAPLQVMSHGHPASSFSDCMDAAFMNIHTFGGSHVHWENQLILQSGVGDSIKPVEGVDIPALEEGSEEVLKIAVPCNVMKINVSFMAALKSIEEQANRPIQFLFFPYEKGFHYIATFRRLRSYFPNCIVALREDYAGYLGQLKQCQMALSPFPFGNSSSSADCLALGLPFIAMIGAEPHSRTDYDILATFGLEDYCVATTVDDYVAGAVSWINNPASLKAMRDMVRAASFLEHHHNDESAFADEFVLAMKWAHGHKDQLRAERGVAYNAEDNWLNNLG
ncbi:MAG: hypothetical protein QE278_01105 [Limnobacter sp.]|nr:hypothetical protein [Limnobacter sp.]